MVGFWKRNDEDEIVEKSEKAPIDRESLVKRVLMGLGAMSLIGLGASGVYYGVKQKPEWFGIKNDAVTEARNKAEIKKLVEEMGKIIELPEGETPTMATVSDLEMVKDQSFFKNAKVDDKVLVYTNAKKAYLYRPSERKIIEVGVVNIPEPTGQTAGTQNQNIQAASPTIIPTKIPTATSKPTATSTPTSTVTPTATQQ